MKKRKKEENGVSRIRALLFLMKPYWKYGKLYLIITLISAAVLKPLTTLLTAIAPEKAINKMTSGGSREQIVSTIVFFALVLMVMSLLQKVQSIYSRIALQKINVKIRNDVNYKALYTDFKYYDNPEYYTKFIFAQEQYPSNASNAIYMVPQFLTALITVFSLSAYIAQAGPFLLGLTVVFVALQGLIGLPKLKPTTQFQVEMTESQKPMQYIDRMLKQKENAAELRSSDAGVKYLKSVHGVILKMQQAYFRFLRKTVPFDIIESVLSPLQIAVVLGYIILYVINGDTTKIGLFASLSIACTSIASNLGSIVFCFNELLQTSLHGTKILEFFKAESLIEPIREDGAAPDDGQYSLQVKDVTFGYAGCEPLFDHLNLKVEKGKRVAIVGENGAGKSSLLKLLIRLYDTNEGEVLINGRNIKEYDIHALRKHIGVAFQDVRILAMSLRETLTVYHDASDEDLVSLLKKMKLEQILEQADYDLGKMLSREFTEDGIVLSGGEAQRLALTRLFFGEFGLLILDEPSASLDPLAEAQLMETISTMMYKTTTVMIAHRLSTVRDFDVIHYMEDGKIIESGSHDELMARKGKYYTMFSKQAEKYQDAPQADIQAENEPEV